MAAITGPTALIALAARLGIPKAAQKLAEKGFKAFQRYVAKIEKQKTKQQQTAGKKFTGEGSKRKQEKVTQRKKPKVDSGLEIKYKQKLKKRFDKEEKFEKKLKSGQLTEKEQQIAAKESRMSLSAWKRRQQADY